MADTFVMSSRQSAELDYAFERNGWTAGDVKWLSEGKNLATILEVRRGSSTIVPVDFFRETGEFTTIQIPALPRPTLEELQAKFAWIQSIESDRSPVDPVTLILGTLLKIGEGAINGAEYQRRRAPKIDICLGYRQAAWLVEHQDEFPELMAQLGKIYIDFPGLVVVSADGYRYFPYLGKDGRRWYLDWGRIEHDLGPRGRFAARK